MVNVNSLGDERNVRPLEHYTRKRSHDNGLDYLPVRMCLQAESLYGSLYRSFLTPRRSEMNETGTHHVTGQQAVPYTRPKYPRMCEPNRREISLIHHVTPHADYMYRQAWYQKA